MSYDFMVHKSSHLKNTIKILKHILRNEKLNFKLSEYLKRK